MKTKAQILFEESNKQMSSGIYPGSLSDKIYNAMQAYADQEVKEYLRHELEKYKDPFFHIETYLKIQLKKYEEYKAHKLATETDANSQE